MFLRTFIYFTKLLFLDLCVGGGGRYSIHKLYTIYCASVALSAQVQKCPLPACNSHAAVHSFSRRISEKNKIR